MNELIIASKFDIEGKIMSVSAIGNGVVNRTYLVETPSGHPNYVLQQKSKSIFKHIPELVTNTRIVSEHIKAKLKARGEETANRFLNFVKSKTNQDFITDEKGNFWTMREHINSAKFYESVSSLAIAKAGGKAIGEFQFLLGDLYTNLEINEDNAQHNIRTRLKQWDEAVKTDKANRVQYLEEELQWVETRKSEMLFFWKLIETGHIPRRIIHNDPQISNVLFSQFDQPLCMIDLDTVSNGTILSDFGQAVQFFANNGNEDETDLKSISLDLARYDSFTEGYLSETTPLMNNHEIQWLAFAPRYITFENVLCYLMDYIEGDTNYKTEYEDQNLVKARAQYKFLTSLEQEYVKMKRFALETFEKHPHTVLRRQKTVKRTYKEIHVD